MNTDVISRDPFVFICGSGEPFRVAWTGIAIILYRWHEPESRWVEVRTISGDEAREFKSRALSSEAAKKYKGKK